MSLKEIKARIASVGNTRKTTSAMKMVSSVKLRKAQQAVQNALPYVEQLDRILKGLVSMPSVNSHTMLTQRPVNRVAIVSISSDSSLCGGFNSNIIKHTRSLLEMLESETGVRPMLFTIGQKITEHFIKSGLDADTSFADILSGREYSDSASLADKLMSLFVENNVDKVVLVYTHFISTGSQKITDSTLLPLDTLSVEESSHPETDFILEPSAEGLLSSLLPQVIRMKVHSALLDSYCSEQAARMIAMQAATDNADNLLGELTLQYNKLRQQAITSELLDLAGGMAANN